MRDILGEAGSAGEDGPEPEESGSRRQEGTGVGYGAATFARLITAHGAYFASINGRTLKHFKLGRDLG